MIGYKIVSLKGMIEACGEGVFEGVLQKVGRFLLFIAGIFCKIRLIFKEIFFIRRQ